MHIVMNLFMRFSSPTFHNSVYHHFFLFLAPKELWSGVRVFALSEIPGM